MEHLAIDLGGRESQICLRAPDGSILREARVATRELEEELKRSTCRVVMETCAEAFGVADAALLLGHQARVVPATLARALGVGARKLKTDIRDARALSEASCRMDLPSVHIPSAWSRETKSLCGMRDALVHSRTMQINTVRGWLRGRRVRLITGDAQTFPTRVRQGAGELPDFVERQLRAIESLTTELKAADKELAARAKAHEVCSRLMTVPGVGPQTAVRYVAAIDEVSRFGSPGEIESYLGLTPGEDSSSDRKRRTSITKAGPASARWVLVQACWSMKRTRPNDPMVLWGDKIAQRRGKRIAIIAMARKLAGILYAYSGPSRSPIPEHADHPFWFMPITDSGPSRSPLNR
jgi:transposase